MAITLSSCMPSPADSDRDNKQAYLKFYSRSQWPGKGRWRPGASCAFYGSSMCWLTGLGWRLHPEEHTAFSKPGLPLQFSQTLVKLCVCHLESTSYCGADVVQSCVEPDPWCHQCMLQKNYFDPSADTQHRQSPCRKLILPMGARTAELMGLT